MKKSFFGIELLVLLLIILVNCASAAPTQWRTQDGGNNHWYEKVYKDYGIIWENARSEAAGLTYDNMNGHLAIIDSSAENNFVTGISQNGNPYPYTGYWMGGFQTDGITTPNVGWNWIPNSAWTSSTYTNWSPSEPNDYGGPGNEDRLVFNSDGSWNDGKQSVPAYGYIVEYEPQTSVPEFPSVAVPVAAILGLVLIFGRRRNMV